MLGNDVVDLTIDNKKHLNQRFVNRTLTKLEQKYLSQSQHKNNFLWSLWAVKEASYKACQKLNKQLLFSPSQFELNQSCLKKLTEHDCKSPFLAALQHQNTSLQLQLSWQAERLSGKLTDNYTAVHAIAMQNNDLFNLSDVQVVVAKMKQLSTYKNQYSEVRKLAKRILQTNDIAATVSRPIIEVKDYSKPGPPILISNDQTTLPHEISLSHDNQWLAVALLIK